jgi:hypothetical protein
VTAHRIGAAVTDRGFGAEIDGPRAANAPFLAKLAFRLVFPHRDFGSR